MIRFVHKGNFKHTEGLFKTVKQKLWLRDMNRLGQEGVNALSTATPKDTGLTAASWTYELVDNPGEFSIVWSNTNVNNNGRYEVNIAVLLQYGHATRNGGWVEGRDYINPALQPIFDRIANDAWEVIIRQ